MKTEDKQGQKPREVLGTPEAAFLERIAGRLGRDRRVEPPSRGRKERGAPEFWQGFKLAKEERVRRFMSGWESLGGKAERCASLKEAAARLAGLFDEMEVKHLIRWDHPMLNRLHLTHRLPQLTETVCSEGMASEQIKKSWAQAGAGLVVADFAIADTGTVVLASGKTRGRSVSLLPPVLVVLVRAGEIVTRMGEALSRLKKRYDANWPAGIHFVTGPSRSADIENDLTIGVHGPGKVIAVVVDRCEMHGE